jgi:hydrogenase maturation protease
MSGTLVIGVGNDFRNDDAIGLMAARHLKTVLGEAACVEECSGDGVILQEMWENAERVILVDALSSGRPPGTIYRLEIDETPLPSRFFNSSTHNYVVAEAIEMARALGQLPPHVVIIGIEGEDFGYGQQLTSSVRNQFDRLVETVKQELAHS